MEADRLSAFGLEAVHLNNSAVSLIALEEAVNAMDLLVVALHLNSKELDSLDRTSGDPYPCTSPAAPARVPLLVEKDSVQSARGDAPSTDAEAPSDHHCWGKAPSLHIIPLPPSSRISTDEATATTFYSMYERCMVLSEAGYDRDILHSRTAECYLYRTAAVITYNMAFLYHFHGLRRGGEPFLRKALQLYEAAFVVIDQIPDFLDDVECLLFAVLNNTGHVHACLQQHEQATLYFDRLRTLLSFSFDPRSWETIPESEYAVFLLNTKVPSETRVTVALVA